MVFGDAQHLPFKNESFDVIICTEVLEHIKDDVLASKELIRILKKNGHLLLTVPNLEKIPLEMGIKEHYRHYLKKDLQKLFSDLKIIKLHDRIKFGEDSFLCKHQSTFFKVSGIRKILILPIIFYEAIIRFFFTYIFSPLSDILLKNKLGSNLILIAKKD